MTTRILLATAMASTLAACASPSPMPMPMPMFSQASLPDAVKVPAGFAVAMETVGVGEITDECKAKAGPSAMAGEFEWVFVGPKAMQAHHHQAVVAVGAFGFDAHTFAKAPFFDEALAGIQRQSPCILAHQRRGLVGGLRAASGAASGAGQWCRARTLGAASVQRRGCAAHAEQ